MGLLTSLFIVAGFALVVVNRRPVQFVTAFFAPLGSQVRTAIQTVSDLLERRFVQFAGVPYQSPASRQEWEELWEAELDSYGTATRVEAWRGCSDPRVLATSADETDEALLPQLVRTKVTTSATSLSESRQAKRGMVNCAKAARGGYCFGSRSNPTQTRMGYKEIRQRALQDHDPDVLIGLEFPAEFVEFLRQNVIKKI
jgi:hypothetical protein